MPLPKTLKQRIDVYKNSAHVFRDGNELFGPTSWFAVMHGQGLKPKSYHPNTNIMPERELEKRMTDIGRVWSKCLEQMPSHQSFIDQHCNFQKRIFSNSNSKKEEPKAPLNSHL